MLDNPGDAIFCALDTSDIDRARELAHDVRGIVGGIKLGKEFFSAHGPAGVRELAKIGPRIFLDLKFHDIPNTVAGAVRSVVPLAPYMINVHAHGGAEMMQRARTAAHEKASELGIEPPLVIGVTILTHIDQQAYERLTPRKVTTTVAEHAVHLAELAKESGLDGVVCSAEEITAIRNRCGPNFKLVVPGLRPPWVENDDQRRIMSPEKAWELGADYLVIGRPITK